MLPDPRLKLALTNDLSSRNLLSALHQQILNTRDATLLSSLLSQYLVTASTRVVAPALPQPIEYQRESRMQYSITNIMKAVQDKASSIIQNLK